MSEKKYYTEEEIKKLIDHANKTKNWSSISDSYSNVAIAMMQWNLYHTKKEMNK